MTDPDEGPQMGQKHDEHVREQARAEAAAARAKLDQAEKAAQDQELIEFVRELVPQLNELVERLEHFAQDE